MKWHPDRNPGREAEVSPRFQLIQSAHEILSDESQKRQYDEARGSVKGRYATGASGVRGNPWANAADGFAPPPRRQAQPTSSSQPRPPPSSGAQRYAQFTNGMPKTSRQAPEEDAQWRRSTASAFENMRKGRSRPPPPPPTPPRAPTAARQQDPSTPGSSARPQPPPPPPRTASQAQKAQASFGNSTRRTGFHPHAQGDEPPVTSKNYYTDRSHSQYYDATPPEPTEIPNASAASGIPDPLAQFRETGADRRTSTPYTTGAGEKTSLFNDSPNIGRAASTRNPIPRKEVPSHHDPPRPRSSSPTRPSANASPLPGFASPSQSRASERYTPRPETARTRPFFDDVSPTREASSNRESSVTL